MKTRLIAVAVLAAAGVAQVPGVARDAPASAPGLAQCAEFRIGGLQVQDGAGLHQFVDDGVVVLRHIIVNG